MPGRIGIIGSGPVIHLGLDELIIVKWLFTLFKDTRISLILRYKKDNGKYKVKNVQVNFDTLEEIFNYKINLIDHDTLDDKQKSVFTMGHGSDLLREDCEANIQRQPKNKFQHYKNLVFSFMDLGFKLSMLNVRCPLLKKLFNEISIVFGSNDKMIPKFLYKLSKEDSLQFLAGAVDGDGHLKNNSEKIGIGHYTFSQSVVNEHIFSVIWYNTIVNGFYPTFSREPGSNGGDEKLQLSFSNKIPCKLDKKIKVMDTEFGDKKYKDRIKLIQNNEELETTFYSITLQNIPENTFIKTSMGYTFPSNSNKVPKQVSFV